MIRWRKFLRLDDEPAVSDDERAELARMQRTTAVATAKASEQAVEAHRLARYLYDARTDNHIAARLNIAITGGRH